MTTCFFGLDFLGELSISGGGQFYRHVLTAVGVEQCQAGHGFNFVGANLGGASLVNCSAQTCAGAGVLWNPTTGVANDDVAIIGGYYEFNGSGIPGGTTYGGVEILVGTASITGIRALTEANGIPSGYSSGAGQNQFNQVFGIVNAATVFGGANHLGTNSGTLPTTYTFQY
jgi:hypothetical protein